MTLLITVFAAVFSTLIWYLTTPKHPMNLGVLCFMYWGASIMWFVDSIYEYLGEYDKFFSPSTVDMLNDTFLGLSVVALGLVIWIVVLLVKDPQGHLKDTLFNK